MTLSTGAGRARWSATMFFFERDQRLYATVGAADEIVKGVRQSSWCSFAIDKGKPEIWVQGRGRAVILGPLEARPELKVEGPTYGWVDAAFRAMYEFADPSYPTSIRQPILIVAAGRDELVSTPAIGQFAVRLRAGSHLVIPGARHELLMEQDRFRSQFWAAFDAFVPGSPLFG